MNTDDWFAAALITAVAAYIGYDATRILRNHRAHKRFVRNINAYRAHQARQQATTAFLAEWINFINLPPDDRDAITTFHEDLNDDVAELFIAHWTAVARAEDERRKGDQS